MPSSIIPSFSKCYIERFYQIKSYLIASLKSQSNEVTGQRNLETQAALVGNFLKKFAGLPVPDKGRFVGKQSVHLKNMYSIS